jgi:SPP1 family predicted phage head-tail adaptor
MRRRVHVQQNVPTQSGAGQQKPNWTTVTTCWAKIEPLQGREIEKARAIHHEAEYKVVLRYFTPFDESYRLVDDLGRIIYLLSLPIDTETRHIEWVCTCKGGV